MTRNVFLYGPPASGKSTLARLLAERLDLQSVDLDARIAEKAGRSIPEIFAREGESGFRKRECAALRDCVNETTSDVRLVALGGGTLLNPENRAFCEAHGTVICLDTPSPEERARRLGNAPNSRPLGDKALERAAHYASFPHRIHTCLEAGPSAVVIGSGFAVSLTTEHTHLVMDANVARLHGASWPTPLHVQPSGEKYKTLDCVARMWQTFAHAGLGRRDTVTALGGGVTGDMTGFAAATWMRGIDWINVPTTLLAMVDASTGGKTGCDLPEGKNLVGTFHPPRLVLIDTDFLATLPPNILAAGRAEMIKHVIIGGLPLGECASNAQPTAAEIARNLRVKIDIVRQDPFEKTGQRLLLNCGHTVAHAIEKLTDYAVSHGDAVAIGCVTEAHIAARRGLASAAWPRELAEIFATAGLPTTLPDGLDDANMRIVMQGDKKRAGSVVTFALPCGWGDVRAVPIDLSQKEALW